MNKINASTEIYGVFGNPVRHSKSPLIHNAWIQDFGINAVYLAFEPSEQDFETCFQGLKQAGLKGANFTTPFKERAANLANQKGLMVANINAANTVKIENDKIIAEITDGAGLLCDLDYRQKGIVENSKEISVLGAGGAAKGLICELIGTPPEKINVIARDMTKITRLISEIGQFLDISKLNPVLWDEKGAAFGNSQIIINATSLGLAGNGDLDCDFSQCQRDTLVYDMIYYPPETKFLANARQSGLKTLNGLGMLVGQAAIAFEFWFGEKPDFAKALKRLSEND